MKSIRSSIDIDTAKKILGNKKQRYAIPKQFGDRC